MELSNEQVIDLFDRLGRIEQQLETIGTSGQNCAVHSEQIKDMTRRLEIVEGQQGKQNLIAVTLGAIGAAIVLAVKYLAVRTS
jgi:hypothetical protein